MSIPNTFIIGVQKAGTTTLHSWLNQHPDIYGPEYLKDVDYFANPEKADKAKERLQNDYAGHNGQSIILQTQVNYIFYPEAIKKIKSLTPDAKLILILREPAERALSAYQYFKKMGGEVRAAEEALLYQPKKDFSFSRNNSDFMYLEHGFYGKQLETVLDSFSRKQLFVLSFENLKENPKKVLQLIYSFLEIRKDFKPDFKKQNTTGNPRLAWLHSRLTTTTKARQIVIKLLIDWWLPPKKRQLIRKKLIEINTTEKENKEHSDFSVIKTQLEEMFLEDQKKLEQLLGPDFRNL